MPKTASLEQTIDPNTKTQKELLLTALKQHRENLDGLIDNIDKSLTAEELKENMKKAATNMIQKW